MPDNQSAVPVSQRAREAADGNNPVSNRARALTSEICAELYGAPGSADNRRAMLAEALKVIREQSALLDEARDILAGQSVPEGYVLVPKVPTGEMIRSAQVPDDRIATAIWSAMLAASPSSDSPAIPELDRGGENLALKYRQDQQRRDQVNENVREMEARLRSTPASHTAPDALREAALEAFLDALAPLMRECAEKLGEPFPEQSWREYKTAKPDEWSRDEPILRAGIDAVLALATPAPSRDEVGREALESALRALAIDSTPIIRRLARIQIKAALNKDTGDVQ